MATPQEPEAGLDALLSAQVWKRRTALWGGAILVAAAAILFARAADFAFQLFRRIVDASPWWALLVTPTVFAALAWATSRGLEATRGSGIPQVIAGLRMDAEERQRHLSLKVAAAKMAMTVIGLFGGASIGREGPTVHVGAGIMQALGRGLGFRDDHQTQRFLLAGGAAGIAAALTRRWPAWCSRSRNSAARSSTASPARCSPR
jgi:H+/Cl- antiporter ClcA